MSKSEMKLGFWLMFFLGMISMALLGIWNIEIEQRINRLETQQTIAVDFAKIDLKELRK